jgi:hypothetical protein
MDDRADSADDRLIGLLKSMDSANSFGKAYTPSISQPAEIDGTTYLYLGGVLQGQNAIRLLQDLSKEQGRFPIQSTDVLAYQGY